MCNMAIKDVRRLIGKTGMIGAVVMCSSVFASWEQNGSVLYTYPIPDIRVGVGTDVPGYNLTGGSQAKPHVTINGNFTASQIDWRLWVSNLNIIENATGTGVGIRFQHGVSNFHNFL